MHHTLFPATLEHYGDKVRFIYKDFPLVEIHPWAMHAAVDANCLAAESGPVYWAYVDYVHSHGQMKEAESLAVDGTPALFIEGERIGGALPQSQVWLVIDRALRAAGVQPPPAPHPSAPVPPSGAGK